jgi:TonB family protein
VVLTEVTWLDAVEPAAAAPAPTRVREVPVAEPMVGTQRNEEKFVREMVRAETTPAPQTDRTSRDKLEERLTALQQNATAKPLTAPVPAATLSPVAAAAPARIRNPGAPANLRRDATASPNQPLELKRTEAPSRVDAVAASLPAPEPTSARIERVASTARRDLAGATLVGPVADRKLIDFHKPIYPDWAKREAVEATVRLYFIVLRDGAVKENVMVQKTSGYEDFDGNARDALLAWRFEALPKGSAGEQWGEITFHYRLSE